MKKFFTFISLCMIAFNAIHAEITWTLSNGTLTISGTGMPDYGYYDYSPWHSQTLKIKKIVIENGVTNIGNNAFFSCSGLTSITIPNSVTSIGECAFCGCRGMTSITIPNSVKSIGDGAFQNCSGLTSITIPNSVKTIGEGAFYSCSGLTSITMGNSVMSIGSVAFTNCSYLTSVHISDLEAWCKISFSRYESNPLCHAHHLYMNGSEITKLVIPNSVTSIGDNAFFGCSGLTSVTIPNNVTNIGERAFQGCSGLTSIAIPNSVKSIGEGAFLFCSGLTSITIPNSVTSIGEYAFQCCSSLPSITIPNSVTSIGKMAFSGCSGLISINVENGNTTYDSRDNCNAIIETNTNALITGCKNTIIPNSVKSIGEHAFSSYDLPEVISMIENPFDINTNTFSDKTFRNATLYIPIGTIEKYKATEGWKKFAFIKERFENSITQVRANALLIQSENRKIIINGVDDGTNVSVYNTNGVLSGTAISHNGSATINTNLQMGSVAIVKIGEKQVKVIIR